MLFHEIDGFMGHGLEYSLSRREQFFKPVVFAFLIQM